MNLDRRAVLGGGAATVAILAAGCAPGAKTPGPSAELTAILDKLVTDTFREAPEYATALAIDEAKAGGPYMARYSDASRAGTERQIAINDGAAKALKALDRAKLNHADQVTLDVVLTSLDDGLKNSRFGYGNYGGGAATPYVLSQLTGAYQQYPDFLDSQHPIKDKATADAFLARMQGFATILDQETERTKEDVAKGVVPPDFVLARTLTQMNAFLKLHGDKNPIVASMKRRIPDAKDVAEADRAKYVSDASGILEKQILPALARQADLVKSLQPKATHDAGVWRLPQGAELYAAALAANTTTTMSPDEVHNMGLEIAKGIKSEMEAILTAQGLTRGSFTERMAAVSKLPGQVYPNTDPGREELLKYLNQCIEDLQPVLQANFGVQAKAKLQIKRVPPTIEAGAPGGYYNGAALDGSRPGSYYINLRDTAETPKYTLRTLTYHEGEPGHHWQISIQQESQSLPFIRSAMLGFNAYAEGWALYAEKFCDEAGVYKDDPLGRLGYLKDAAFRASRLVVDTGMHFKKWSREDAIKSMMETNGDNEASVTTEIERYCVWPGQACGYMIGREKIYGLRENAKKTLGDKFDIKGFHDAVLTNGSVPLSVLETIVGDWVASKQKA